MRASVSTWAARLGYRSAKIYAHELVIGTVCWEAEGKESLGKVYHAGGHEERNGNCQYRNATRPIGGAAEFEILCTVLVASAQKGY